MSNVLFPRELSKARGAGRKGSFPCRLYAPTWPCTSSTHSKGFKKCVQQMMLLNSLAEIPLFYPWKCGSKAKTGQRKHTGARQRRWGKMISLFDQRNTSSFMYWQRKAHGDGGNLARHINVRSTDDFTICFSFFFLKERISLWHGKPFEDTNKKHIEEIL